MKATKLHRKKNIHMLVTHTHTRTHIHRIGINVIANIYIESPIGPDQELARCFLNPHTR